MTGSEAREILELTDEEPTRDQVRRAYMRKLKAHPPERDPEGFQRLRAAYEYLLPPKEAAPAPIAIPAVEVVESTPEPAAEPVLEQYAWLFVEQLLDHLRTGNLDEAEALAARVKTAIADDRDQLDMVGAARWLLISELVFVARQLPAKLVRAFVIALTEEDVSKVEETLRTEAEWDPAKVEDLDRYLGKRAPNLWLWATGRQAPAELLPDPIRIAVALGILGIVVALIAWSQC